MDKLDCMIRYIVEKAPRSGRTQIVKFLYLADLEARRFLGRPLTSLQYIFHNHGPFEQKIYSSITRLEADGFLTEEQVEYSPNRRGYQYIVTEKPAERDLEGVDRGILDAVVSRVSKMRLQDLLDLTYGTPPMRKAIAENAKGKVLEMNSVDDEFFKTTGIRHEEILEGLEQIKRGESVVLDENFDENFDKLFATR